MTDLWRRLAFRVLTPIIIFGLGLGITAILFMQFAVSQFVERQATNDLRWRSFGVYHIIDSNLDELQRSGRAGDEIALRQRKVNALMSIEDFARVNELRVTVRDIPATRTVELGADLHDKAGSGDTLVPLVSSQLRYYTHSFRFEPWGWEIALTQDNRAYLGLLGELLWGAGVAAFVFVGGITAFMVYLTNMMGRPIRKIINDVENNRPPHYKGIAEFEYLGKSISAMMGSIREQSELLEATFVNIGEGLCVFDTDLRCLSCNRKYLDLYGMSGEAIDHAAEITTALNSVIAMPLHVFVERARKHMLIEHTRPDGRVIEITVDPMGGGRYVSTHSDITERKASEARIRELATHDALTRQPNRFLFQDRLHQAIATARRTGAKGGILFIDLDRFKDVNDTLGHEVGDQLLQEIATRINMTIRDSDTAARFGGDEFAVLIPTADGSDELAHVAEKLVDALTAPFSCRGNMIQTGASIGVTMFPEDGSDVISLLRNADIALYEAKGAGRGQYRFFTEKLNSRVQERATLVRDLRRAIEKDELVLRYQPQVDLQSRQIVGVEALLRWHHPKRGTLPPATFIPLAEQTGFIVPLGEWVLRQACAQADEWRRGGLTLRVGVNVSAVQIRRSDVVSAVERALAEYSLPPELLELEITESAFLEDPESTIAVFQRIRDLGVRISLDDFGTGYSSLSYLRRLPLTNIKIDQSFIHDINVRASGATIVRAIIGLAHGLGDIRVIAEGVENWTQYQTLLEMNCDEAQGFMLCGPIGPAQVVDLPHRRIANGNGGTVIRFHY